MLSYSMRLYYYGKLLIPRRLQIALRGHLVRRKRRRYSDIWPIDERASQPPKGWTGWPDGKRFALVLTHDVESQKGHDQCLKLAGLDKSLGFRSAFNFVAEEYPVSPNIRKELLRQGFEVGLHGLRHNGSLYQSEKEFLRQATRINRILKDWNVAGFRSPSMYRNLEWLHALHIQYDASTFDTDPFEPQPEGLGTIFPLHIRRDSGGSGYVEIPYTLPQDFTVFILMKEKSIDVWKRKLDWIVEHGGLALINTHPDYMVFDGVKPRYDSYLADMYASFLEYIKNVYAGAYWHVLPREIARFWAARSNHGDR